jgi:integrase
VFSRYGRHGFASRLSNAYVTRSTRVGNGCPKRRGEKGWPVDRWRRSVALPESKTEAGKRTLQVPDLLQDRLLELAEGKKPTDLLFGYHDRNWPRKWVVRICKAAGVPQVTAHGMRGLHGTLAVETGISAHAVAAALGHESVTTTLQSYAKAGAGTSVRQQKVLTVLAGGKKEQEHAA